MITHRKLHSIKHKHTYWIILIVLIIGGIGIYSIWNTKPVIVEDETEDIIVSDEPQIVAKDYTLVNLRDAQELTETNSNLVIIDFGTPLKYSQSHIKGAVNYPLEDLDTIIKTLDKNKDYLVYDRFPDRIFLGTIKLSESGFNVYRLKGNFGAWVDAGYPIEKK